MHATTKYLGGHSDVLGGALVLKEKGELFQRINSIQMTGGSVPSPFECWLTMRGIRTLPLRVHRHSANALALAEFLAAHPRVEVVHYPGLPSHPAYAIARRQMSGFGGMLSVQVGAQRRGGARRRQSAWAVHASDEFGRHGEPCRASCLGGRSGHARST